MFRRPKKQIRPRVITMGDEDEDNEIEVEEQETFAGGSGKKSVANGSLKKESLRPLDNVTSQASTKSSLLSFDEELEGDDGEVFKVKKSSVSRRLIKQRNKDKGKKDKLNDTQLGKMSEKKDSKVTSDKLSVSNKPSMEQVPGEEEAFLRILSGREAEAVDMESSDEDDASLNSKNHRFRRPLKSQVHDEVKRVLERGGIPDANLIHEARKRKQMAREMSGSIPEHIPLDNTERYRPVSSRLVRDDDENDHSEEEERIDFSSATQSAKIERDRKKEAFAAARDEERDRISAGESDPELEEWEKQQIRKGVSKAKIHSVAKEVYNQNQFADVNEEALSNLYTTNETERSDAISLAHGQSFSKTDNSDHGYSVSTNNVSRYTKNLTPISSYNMDDFMTGNQRLTPDLIFKQMTERLQQLKEAKERQEGQLSRTIEDLKLCDKECLECEGSKDGLNSRFILYQNLRGYVTDLVDCLRFKMPSIEGLENRFIELVKARSERLTERRRQDVKDQTEEIKLTVDMATGNSTGNAAFKPSDIRSRRAAEREGRRTRRRRARELKNMKGHRDGMSSDDEETELEIKAYISQLDVIQRDCAIVFDDVNEDFATLNGILDHFAEWREKDFDSYKESYAYMCLPKCLSPLIRLKICTWDPLCEPFDLNKFAWIKLLGSFSYKRNETFQNLFTDPDSRLIPAVAEKVFIPWISRVVTAKWDPMSDSQTRNLVNIISKLIYEWSVGANTKSMHSLMASIIGKFDSSVQNDIYTPIYPKNVIQNRCSPACSFASRQFWSAVKLLHNMSAWQGLLGDTVLQTLALDALLTRYILLGIRTAADLIESSERAQGVLNVLPRAWLSKDSDQEPPNGLLQLSRCLISIVQMSDTTASSNRGAVPEISNILKSIGFPQESKMIMDKYS